MPRSRSGIAFNLNSVTGYANTTWIDVDPLGYGGTFDASENHWGTSDPAVVQTHMLGLIDFTPLLDNGDTAPTTVGFQAGPGVADRAHARPADGHERPVQEGVDVVATSGTVHVAAGSYTESPNLNKALTLSCAQAGQPVGGRTFGAAAEAKISGQIRSRPRASPSTAAR